MPARPPLVSVVVATNRAGEHLGEALDSVAAQTHPAVELIVVDDGSADPDAVAAIVSRASNARLLRQPPTGVSAARNRGAGEARGELLTFLDDDDRWHPERLARHAAVHVDDPDAVASYCGIQTIDATGERVLAPADQVAVASTADIARRRTGILLGNLVMRRDRFAEVGGFDEGLRLAEDYDLILRLAQLGRFAFVPGALVDYRSYGENSTIRHRELVASIDEIVRRHERAARESGDDELVAALRDSARKNDRFAWWSAGRAARRALGERHPLRAVSEVWWALRTAPLGLVDGVARRVRGSSD
ncbi:glycosyltransferase family 2 protein [Microbacterium immunditiarum]|uniref:Glycosyltransferase involved in cell wall biosynthesis n=1 Tax=Microbacterium immunditiarum TaxID=337480 RepID=A0A7Y9KK12_9MICO|nr:glycosyltransferase family A protein [Microbacterium immunditiarum]NYE18728.1 glycosyltransferase involved in cell wall biosynthesis [Microbacterium immunditiarum]